MTKFGDDVEKQCRRIVRQRERSDAAGSPATSVRREVALLLSEMDSMRERTERQRRQFLRRELEIGTQILNLEDRVDLVPAWIERISMINEARRTLDHLRTQIHRLSWESESALQRIRMRLLELWNIHDQLVEEHGNT